MGPSCGIDAPKSIHAWAESRRRTSTTLPTHVVACTVREPWIMWGEAMRRDPIIVAPPGVVLLWALACEIDDRGATFTGDLVCRACSGRGVILDIDPGLQAMAMAKVVLGGGNHVAVWEKSCDCTGPTRPDTVSLAWLVAHLASQRTPLVNDWPDQWRVDRDQERARGDNSWQARWWLAFETWVTCGVEPDADLLGGLLRALTYLGDWAAPPPPTLPDSERPWFDIGDGIVYVDDIRVDHGVPEFDAFTDGLTGAVHRPRETTIEISMSSASDHAYHAYHRTRLQSSMHAPRSMTVGGGQESASFPDVAIVDVESMRVPSDPDDRMTTTVRCVTMERFRIH